MIRRAVDTLRSAGSRIVSWFRPRPNLRLVASNERPIEENIPAPSTPPQSRPEPSQKRKALRNLSRQRIRLSTSIDDVISRLEGVSLHSFRGEKRLDPSKNELMRELIGQDYHHFDEVVDEIRVSIGQSEMVFFDPEVDLRELVGSVWPIDIGMAIRRDERVVISRVKSIHPRELRGKSSMTSKFCASISHLSIYNDGHADGETVYAALIGNKFTPVDNLVTERIRSVGGTVVQSSKIIDAKNIDDVNFSIGIALSVKMSMRYEWHVALGNNTNGTRLLIPTSPAGCLSFFKNREKDSGLSRRAALRHWVHNHFRNTSEVEMAYVRDHLRGTIEFKWHNLDAMILVSEFDLERNEFFKEQAEQWRRSKKHNSVKIRLKKQKTLRDAIGEKQCPESPT